MSDERLMTPKQVEFLRTLAAETMGEGMLRRTLLNCARITLAPLPNRRVPGSAS